MARSSVIRTEEEEASLASENKEERGRAPLSAIFFSPFPFFFPFTCKVGKTGITQVLPRDARRCCQERQAPPRCGAVRCGALLKARRAPPDPTPQHAGSYVHAHKHNEEGASAARIRSYGCGVPFSSFFLLSPLPPLPLPRPALGAIGWLLPLQPDRPATALERARGFKPVAGSRV